MSKELKNQKMNTDEIDLGQLFNAIGRLFLWVFKSLKDLFLIGFQGLAWLIIFVKKNIILLAAAGIVGFVYGYYKENYAKPVYSYESIIRQNYGTGESLNDYVNYLNELISEEDSVQLGSSLNIASSEASKLNGVNIEPILTRNQQMKAFDLYRKSFDSVIAIDLDFDEYVENTKDYNYRDIILSIQSEELLNFNTILNAIIDQIEATDFIQNEQKKDLAQLTRTENSLREALQKSDSLQKVYQDILAKSVEPREGAQTSVSIDNTQDRSLTREYDLFSKDLELRQRLVEIAREKEDKEFIIEILSSSSKTGVIVDSFEVFDRNISYKLGYLFLFGTAMLILLLFIRFLGYIEEFSNRQAEV